MNNATGAENIFINSKSSWTNLASLNMDPKKLKHMKAPLKNNGFCIDNEDATFPKSLINLTLPDSQSNMLLNHSFSN